MKKVINFEKVLDVIATATTVVTTVNTLVDTVASVKALTGSKNSNKVTQTSAKKNNDVWKELNDARVLLYDVEHFSMPAEMNAAKMAIEKLVSDVCRLNAFNNNVKASVETLNNKSRGTRCTKIFIGTSKIEVSTRSDSDQIVIRFEDAKDVNIYQLVVRLMYHDVLVCGHDAKSLSKFNGEVYRTVEDMIKKEFEKFDCSYTTGITCERERVIKTKEGTGSEPYPVKLNGEKAN